MTPQVTHPGVYVAELPAEGHKIVGVSSSITAFIGRASKGPFNRAIKCKSIRGAVRRFGGPHPRSELARSLKMFFDNGGRECFVVRLEESITADSYTGIEVPPRGLHALDTVKLFNLMVLPADRDVNLQEAWKSASKYCKQRGAVLLMDPPRDWTRKGRPTITRQKVDDLRSTVATDNCAVFYPRVRTNRRGRANYLGPTGAVAGVIARVEHGRGVWKVPAGTEAHLKGITGLEVKLASRHKGIINSLGVNCLRNLPQQGFVIWGARTLEGDDHQSSEWKYLSVRRLALFIEKSIEHGTHWVVFEPNPEPLWTKVRLNVGGFLMKLFRDGAFQGATPNEAFFVKCDRQTTTQEDVNEGVLNFHVGFAPLKPAEFVIVKIRQKIVGRKLVQVRSP